MNSRDATAGVGTITIETSNVTLEESSTRGPADVAPGDYVLLRFADTGSGMTSDVLERVFEPFFTTKAEGRGTGLGLSTVYGIVTQSGGAIGIDSAPGRGTTVSVYFPRYHGEPEPLDSAAPAAPARGHETVLIAEDEPLVLKLARRILESRGYEVIEATTPGEALLLAEKHPAHIDLLITDVVMPTMNGRELRERIGAIRPGIKTLFMSGYTADIIASRGVIEAGVDFIQKPFSGAALTSKVREVLDGGRQRKR